MGRRFADWPAQMYWGYCAGVMLLAAAIGCGQSGTAPGGNTSVMAAADEAAVPKGNAIADPVLREARDQADEVLHGLLAGMFDQEENLAGVGGERGGVTPLSRRAPKNSEGSLVEIPGTCDA